MNALTVAYAIAVRGMRPVHYVLEGHDLTLCGTRTSTMRRRLDVVVTCFVCASFVLDDLIDVALDGDAVERTSDLPAPCEW